jgi:hypothetical protein
MAGDVLLKRVGGPVILRSVFLLIDDSPKDIGYAHQVRLKASNKKGTGTSQVCLLSEFGEGSSEPVPFLLGTLSLTVGVMSLRK